jgi:hypothetical protein
MKKTVKSQMLIVVAAMLTATVTTVACTNSHAESSSAPTATAGADYDAYAADEDDAAADSLQLELPDIPVTLTEPHSRALFLLDHYWDALDFANDARACDTTFIEQNFANYVSLFQLAELDELSAPAAKLLTRSRVNTAAYNLMQKVVEHYLYDVNSPMLNEDYYALFLPTLIADTGIDAASRQRYRFDQECIAKNHSGSMAPDFTYVTTDGRRCTLRRTPVEGRLMLIFYDPDCEECKATLADLKKSAQLNSLIADGRVTVLAVCVEGDRDNWLSAASELPDNWTVAYDVTGIEDHDLYFLRAMPTIYVLDATSRILLKDVRVPQALESL